MAAIGASNETKIIASGFIPPPWRPPPTRPENIAIRAMLVTTAARAPATHEIRMSRLYTCDSSWPSTARSSRSSRICRMPVVQHTAALRGLRPVAKALGLAVSLMYSCGMGWWAAVDNSRTMAWICGA